MGTTRRRFLGLAGWVAGLSGLHLWLNFDWDSFANARLPRDKRKLMVGYIPVT